MHVAFLTAEYPPMPGGVGDYTCRLALALQDCGHTITVITGGAASSTSEPAPSVERSVSGWGWRCWRDTIAALDRLRPDVLHIQYQTGAYSMHPAVNLLPWRLRGLPGSPSVVVTFHDLLQPYLFPKAGPLRRWITLRLARDAAGVVATNAADAATLRAVVLPSALHTIPIGSNIPVAPPPGYQRAQWRASLGVSPDALLVAYFGLLSRSKGPDVLLDALVRLPPSVRLLLIGGAAAAPHDRAFAAEVRARLQHSNLSERVIHTGHVDAATVSAHLLACDVVALPFRQGASLRSGSLLAALSHGAAVVTTQPAGPQTNTAPLHDGENALLVPPADAAALAAALRRLADDAALRAHLGAAARQLGASFDWQHIARQHEALYAAL
jgi:glycosyltransferase involved in cell wall biosynthesis